MKYPRIGAVRNNPKAGLCIVCGLNKADKLIDVQVNTMRGDDDVYGMHKECYKYIAKKEGQNLAEYLSIRREEIRR